MIDKFYQGDKDIKVIQTHGKGNVKIYVHLLDIYKIPYTIMLDRDATKTQQLRTLMHHMQIHLPPLKDEELIKAIPSAKVVDVSEREDLAAAEEVKLEDERKQESKWLWQ